MAEDFAAVLAQIVPQSDEEIAAWEAERRAAGIAANIRVAGLPRLYEKCTVETFLAKGGDQELLARSAAWLAQIPAGDRGVYLHGETGRGKSWLASHLAYRWLTEWDRLAVYVELAHLLEQMRESFSNGRHADVYERVLSVPLLVLDDVGAERPSEWTCERLYEAVAHRLSTRRPTVYTSNWSLEELEDRLVAASGLQGVRIVERIREHCGPWVISVAGPNLRRRE